jgi:DNA polymerase-3 subunit beta
MKFRVPVKTLKAAVKTVSECIASKPLMPVLAGIKIECTENLDLELTAFNLAEGIRIVCDDCDVWQSGSIVLLEKDLSMLLSKLKNDLELESIDNGTVKIATENSNIELQSLDASEYPELIFDLDAERKHQLPNKSFRDAIAACSVSVSTDETQQLLQGINISASDGVAKVASTDGHRLTVCTFPYDGDIESVTIPANFLANIPNTNLEEITLSIDNNQVLFETESQAICRLYEGKYPNYHLLLPKDFKRNVSINRQELIELLEVAQIALSATGLVQLSIKATTLTISSTRDAASAISQMDCVLNGSALNAGFNCKYLLQALKIFGDETVILSLNGALEPVTIVSLDNQTTHLIMPVQIPK